jgi:IS605 OrfB family transposase
MEKHGNMNVRIIRSDTFFSVNVKYPFTNGSKWIEGTADFGAFNPIVGELVALAEQNLEGYTVRILFNGRFYVHVSVPVELYLNYTRIGYVRGFRFASFDVNSDRCNMAIAGSVGRIVRCETAWFSQVVQHGYPKDKAWNEIVLEVDKLFRIAKGYSVKTLFFEDLFSINGKRVVRGDSARSRRKCSRFMKSKLLAWMILRGLKHGFDVYLVNPAYTSTAGKVIGKRLGLDRHTSSAYAIVLRGTQMSNKYLSKLKQFSQGIDSGNGSATLSPRRG